MQDSSFHFSSFSSIKTLCSGICMLDTADCYVDSKSAIWSVIDTKFSTGIVVSSEEIATLY